MTTKEAIQAMLNGEKITYKGWADTEYLYFDGICFKDEDKYVVSTLNDRLALADSNDWEIYKEPKPKQTITIEKWLVTNGKRFDIAETSDIDAYLGEGVGWIKVKLLHTYEVEL